MSIIKQTPRNLAVSQSWRGGVPDHAIDWTDAELAEWEHYLQTKKPSAYDALAWHNMRQWRHEQDGLVGEVLWRRQAAGIPAEVLATLPLDVMACRYYWRRPALALVSHAAARLIEVIPSGRQPNKAAMERMRAAMARYRGRRGVLRVPGPALELVGGLTVVLNAGTADIALFGQSIRRVNCTDAAQVPLLRLCSLWIRVVRMCLAEAMEHSVAPSGRSLDARVELALPLGPTGSMCEALTCENGRPRAGKRHIIVGRDPFADWPARYRLAGKIIADHDIYGGGAATLVEPVVRAFHAHTPLLCRVTVDAPGREDIQARIDALSRQNIRALRAGREVDLLDPAAERFEVFQDTMTGLVPIAEFTSFGLAIDFERSNRKTVTMRLGVSIGRGRLPMPGEDRMAHTHA